MNVRGKATYVGSALLLLAASFLAACGQGSRQDSAVESSAADAQSEATATVQSPAYATVTVVIGDESPVDYTARIADWKASGLVTEVRLLKKTVEQLAETGKHSPWFDTLAIIEFPNEEAYDAWAQRAPADLGPQARIRRADLLIHKEVNPRDAEKAYFAVNHYESLMPAEDYQAFSEKYIVPNMNGQMDAGLMTYYKMFLEREAEGVNPQAVLVKEYVDRESFEARKAVKDKNKEEVLLKDPEWARYNSIKTTLRTDLHETLAREVK